jgi:exodeoxyribonuclease VII small subunit
MAKKEKPARKIDFEKALEQLEKIVNDLESGGLTLDESIRSFEKGVELSRLCQKKLEAAEERVKKLIEKTGGDFDLELFEEDEGSTNA